MATEFDAWLRQLTVAGMRIPDGRLTINRGLPFYWGFTMGGDWTGAVLVSSLRLTPDAADPVVADFTCETLAYDPTSTDESATGVTPFTITLSGAQTAALTADNDADGVVELAVDFVLTPSGGDPWRLMGGVAVVAGKVTDA